jgi:hypothetical protein
MNRNYYSTLLYSFNTLLIRGKREEGGGYLDRKQGGFWDRGRGGWIEVVR